MLKLKNRENVAFDKKKGAYAIHELPQRKKGAVINISSFSAAIPAPLLSVYSASKSYVDLLSQGMAKEYSSKGITVQCVLPNMVVSNLSKIRRPSLMVPTPNVFVR